MEVINRTGNLLKLAEEKNFTIEEAYDLALSAMKDQHYPLSPNLTLSLCGFVLKEDDKKKEEGKKELLKKYRKSVKFAKKKNLEIPLEPNEPPFYLSELEKMHPSISRSKKDNYFPHLETIIIFDKSLNEAQLNVGDEEYKQELDDLIGAWREVLELHKLTDLKLSFSQKLFRIAYFAYCLRVIVEKSMSDTEKLKIIKREYQNFTLHNDWFSLAVEDVLSLQIAENNDSVPCNMKQVKKMFYDVYLTN